MSFKQNYTIIKNNVVFSKFYITKSSPPPFFFSVVSYAFHAFSGLLTKSLTPIFILTFALSLKKVLILLEMFNVTSFPINLFTL